MKKDMMSALTMKEGIIVISVSARNDGTSRTKDNNTQNGQSQGTIKRRISAWEKCKSWQSSLRWKKKERYAQIEYQSG